MKGPAEFLRVLAEELRGAGVPWMLTGSAASSYYGEPPGPRTTSTSS
ncbi:MAG TPA: hypothetical protein VF554_17550 [Thermoanaerobaculia bacterium]